MKKKILSIILMILIIALPIIENKYDELIEVRNDIDKYIAYNLSNEMNMLFLIIDETNETILVKDNYKNMENAEIEKYFNKVSKSIFLINGSVSELYLLNENYEFNLDNLYNLFKYIEKKAKFEHEIPDHDIELLKNVVEIRWKYSQIKVSQLYKYRTNKLNAMEIPPKLAEFFKALDENLVEYDEPNY